MKLPAAVAEWCRGQGLGEVTEVQPVGGGCINDGAILRTGSGQTLFLKHNPQAPEDMFRREGEGLRALVVQGAPRVPSPLLADQEFLLMEDLSPAPREQGYWGHFGRQLAALHSHTHEAFGFERDNYIGSTPQRNPWTEDGHRFFGQHRLRFQARLATRRGRLSRRDLERVEALADRLEDLIPDQPASLIHGDLWLGNAITDDQGEPALIDPAAHYGWAEAELGMTRLFGAFPETFYHAYEEVRPLEKGWRARLPIYNLYHLLNHLNLFGGAYLGQVQAIMRRYG
jgi:fructosamine-3-kinase